MKNKQQEAVARSAEHAGLVQQDTGLFREVVERFLDTVILIDGKTERIEYANAAAQRVFGHKDTPLVGRRFSVLLPPEDRTSAQEILEKLKVHDAVFTMDLARADGQPVSMDLTATIVRWRSTDFVVLTLRDIAERLKAEQERECLVNELQEALANVRMLSGMLPICASCKRVRDDQGYWNQIEAYIRDHSEAEFSHSICPDCARKMYPEYINDTEGHEKTD